MDYERPMYSNMTFSDGKHFFTAAHILKLTNAQGFFTPILKIIYSLLCFSVSYLKILDFKCIKTTNYFHDIFKG